MRVTISVPATAANLGPGFDCFGLALELCNDVVIDTDAAPGATPGVTWEGEGAGELPTDGSDLLTSSMRRAAGDRVLPSVALLGRNRVPLARGLGSSSAAVVAGVVAAAVLLGDDPAPASVFPIAAAIEGHPDNAAPACVGGFTIATPDGFVRRLDPHPDLRPTVLVPTTVRLATDHARSALPPSVPREDAVANVAAAALAVEAITRAPELLGRALRDRLHQDARLALVPSVRAAFDAVHDAGVPVCVSGAGPSLLAFPDAAHGLPDLGEGFLAMPLAPRAAGFVVEVDRG